MNIAEKLLAIDANTDRVEALNLELEKTLGGSSSSAGSGGGTSIPLQEKTINIVENGTTEVLPDGGYALSKVGVNVNVPIPSGYIKPSGQKEVSENGTYDVAEFEKVNVNVPAPEGDTLTEFLRVKGLEYLFYTSTSATKIQTTDTLAAMVNSLPSSMITGSARYMFGYQKNIETVPLFDTSKVTDMGYMLNGCSRLTTVPLLDTSNVTNMNHMFGDCKELVSVPPFDTSKVTNMGYMFNGCSRLTTVPRFNFSKVTDLGFMFGGCTALTTFSGFDVGRRSGINMTYMFNGCSRLTTVSEFDMYSAGGTSSMFNGCTNLTNLTLTNIRFSLQVGSGTTYGHLLTVESLVGLISECHNGTALRTLAVGAANLEKLANVYVKTIEITDEMRAEDDLIDKKLPFVRCESTDEGAMLIADYVTLKHWALK